jgi:hypothetical protein
MCRRRTKRIESRPQGNHGALAQEAGRCRQKDEARMDVHDDTPNTHQLSHTGSSLPGLVNVAIDSIDAHPRPLDFSKTPVEERGGQEEE